ncbi:hypothetical protein SASPL_151092 [Salvia splendens]|uniref:DNA 3'-5' helicase n=1 Tax=Salvia splendens TaxID=180675 RepID=A0A8X8W7Q1_SALSN|nr:hypothetical protein SASPL_151092 [Salvia splendens]
MVATELRERGITADYYHADMDVHAREKVHTRWSNSKLQVIVGTLVVVRFVVHHSLSKSMETYYQSGRAGRDGLPSECLLYFRPADVPRQSSMVFYENAGLPNLYDIVRYCLSKQQCRRGAIFKHFAEPLRDCNGMCDNCASNNEFKELDVSDHAKFVVSMLQEILEKEQRATMLQLVDKMKIRNKDMDPVLKKEQMEQLIVQLVVDRVLLFRLCVALLVEVDFSENFYHLPVTLAPLVQKEEFQHTPYTTNAYVTVGPLAKQVLHGKKAVKLEVRSGQKSSLTNLKSNKRSRSSGLEFKLDELRKELASLDGGIFPHSVLSTQQISVLSEKKPESMEELEKMIGKVKAEKYGEKILDEIKSYEPKNEIEEEPSVKKNKKPLVVIESSEDEA